MYSLVYSTAAYSGKGKESKGKALISLSLKLNCRMIKRKECVIGALRNRCKEEWVKIRQRERGGHHL